MCYLTSFDEGSGEKSDKIHPLKEAMSSVDKSTIEDLQKKDLL